MQQTLAALIDGLDTTDRGFHFTSRDSSIADISFHELSLSVRGLARRLPALGNQPGDPIVIAIPGQAEFIQAFLSVIRAGFVAVPVYPPSLIGDLESYSADIHRIRSITGAKNILTSDNLYKRLQSVQADSGLVRWSSVGVYDEVGDLQNLNSSDPALIQFTSGSTGVPKGVELSHANLMSNASAITKALDVDPERDRGVSWLPLHHDMGLIGFLITPLLTQSSTWFMPPLDFARRPSRWLELMSQTKATISYAPNFGYELTTRAVKNVKEKQWDLSAWRVAGCGGEPILPEVLDNFAQRLKPARFNKTAFVPSYGLAEATVAVAISSTGDCINTGVVDCSDEYTPTTVALGGPVIDTEIRIVATDGIVLPPGTEGEIQVRGPGVCTRFWTDSGFQSATNQDGWLSTGDLGKLVGAELHVCGRLKESILINGRNYYPHDIEECLLEMAEVKRGGVVAFGSPIFGSEQLVLIVEAGAGIGNSNFQRQLRETVRLKLGLSVADVVVVERGTITRTTSGKIQRAGLKERYLSGEFSSLVHV